MMSSLPLLQLARVKGLLSADAAATVLCLEGNDVAQEFERFRAKGWLDATSRGWRLSPAGRKATAALLEEERAALDAPVLTGLYAEFCVINRELKATMTAWQLRSDGTPNDHSDQGYDEGVTVRLRRLHDSADPLIERIEQAVPRLVHYRRRLSHALDKVGRGDLSYIARPIIDSYHTVWFELHEDLIALNGLTRAAEAQAGRAQ